MRKKIWLPVTLLILAGCSPRSPQRSTAELDALLRAAVDQKRVPGVVAMVAMPEGAVYEASAGLSKDTLFSIASMTKPVTSVAVMQLVEAGSLKLDDPVATYLPELAKPQVLEAGKLRPARNPITVRHLLTHTSGFGYEFMNRDLSRYVTDAKLPGIMAGGDGYLRAPLLFDPGTHWEYGISVDWLGKLVEKVSGQSLEAYFRAKILDPLGMVDTYYNVPPEKQTRIAIGYQRRPDGSLAEQPRHPMKPVEHFPGGHGLYSTAADYLKFTRALLTGSPILKPETVALMGQNHIGELGVRPFSSLAPDFAKDGAALPGGLDKFGLGFALNTRAIEKGRGANTMCWVGIFNTFFWIDREKKLCAVLMTQMSPGLDDGPRTLLEEFDRAVYRWRE
jgi:CubicO group peptidase (beta-lactamase class C family)